MQAKAKQITERVVVITPSMKTLIQSQPHDRTEVHRHDFFHFHQEPFLFIVSLTDTLGIATAVLNRATTKKSPVFRHSERF